MIKKTITSVVDLETGEKATRDYYFNLTKGEALELELMEQLQEVGSSKDPRAIVPVFKKIINYAYGIKGVDGTWDKDPVRTRGFMASDAYSELFLGLLDEGEQGVIDFITQALSFSIKELQENAAKEGVEADETAEAVEAEAPKRAVPQDRLKSARQIAEEAAGNQSIAIDTADGPGQIQSGESEAFAEFQAWKRAKAERAARMAEAAASGPEVDTEDLTSAPSEQVVVDWGTAAQLTSPNVQILGHGTVNGAVVPQALRRDARKI